MRHDKALDRLGVPGLVIPLLLVAGLSCLGYFAADPFTTFPAAAGKRLGYPVAALLLSGNMGLKVGMGPGIANALSARGIPVVGINSLTHFRSERSPAEIVEITRKELTARANWHGRTPSGANTRCHRPMSCARSTCVRFQSWENGLN